MYSQSASLRLTKPQNRAFGKSNLYPASRFPFVFVEEPDGQLEAGKVMSMGHLLAAATTIRQGDTAGDTQGDTVPPGRIPLQSAS